MIDVNARVLSNILCQMWSAVSNYGMKLLKSTVGFFYARVCSGSVLSTRLNCQRYVMGVMIQCLISFFCFPNDLKKPIIYAYPQIDHMFLTRVCSETAGGLPGMHWKSISGIVHL